MQHHKFSCLPMFSMVDEEEEEEERGREGLCVLVKFSASVVVGVLVGECGDHNWGPTPFEKFPLIIMQSLIPKNDCNKSHPSFCLQELSKCSTSTMPPPFGESCHSSVD